MRFRNCTHKWRTLDVKTLDLRLFKQDFIFGSMRKVICEKCGENTKMYMMGDYGELDLDNQPHDKQFD